MNRFDPDWAKILVTDRRLEMGSLITINHDGVKGSTLDREGETCSEDVQWRWREDERQSKDRCEGPRQDEDGKALRQH